MRRSSLGLAALALIAFSGCGTPRSRVHGIIRYKGQPLASATIIFLAPDNQTYPARTKGDGSYDIASVPRGKIQVAILVEEPRVPPRAAPSSGNAGDEFAAAKSRVEDAAKQKGAGPTAVTPAVQFPAYYNDPAKSGLGFDLQDADQDYSLDLN
jgi:hypothetical protein